MGAILLKMENTQNFGCLHIFFKSIKIVEWGKQKHQLQEN
jgi:hypothetical protein